MRLQDLTLALRPRSGWEAAELGCALARRHYGAIWRPWWTLALPLFVLANALCWALDLLWLAPLLLWWLKPAFDRIPLYVLSRAAFGQVPRCGETVRALWQWGRPFLFAHLLWRRLGPVRALYLPVDLLERSAPARARERRRALGGPAYGTATMLTLVFAHFEIALYLGLAMLVLVFVPQEYLGTTAQWLWRALEEDAAWLGVASNAALWIATSVLEPFYVGAGFGLYLNRRTEIEGWDIELAFRRLRERLRTAAPALSLLLLLALAPGARAQDERPPTATPAEVFGPEQADDAGLRRAVAQAYADPRVTPKRTVRTWKPRQPAKPERRSPPPPWLAALSRAFAALAEYGLWLLFALFAAALLLTAKRWWPWLVERATREPAPLPETRTVAYDADAPLPADIAGAVRALWHAGRPRDALALMYRAAVAAMAARAQVDLVPGATEAECLRAARELPEAADREAFADAVRIWQYAAYAQRLPDEPRFEQVLRTLGARFGWAA
ncbi:MAG TPA: DUF4129 domain-containing protein [Lysobacter sp.]|nr:DUF4129 domain-containing protein [Lysobacter sp.]